MEDQCIYGLIFETRVNDKLSCQIFSTSDSIYPKNEEVIKIEIIQIVHYAIVTESRIIHADSASPSTPITYHNSFFL